MYYKLSASQENELLNQPETGMGFQIIEVSKTGSYSREKFIVLNSEIVIELNGYEANHIKDIISLGIIYAKANATLISLYSVIVYSESQFRSVLNEGGYSNGKGAIESSLEPADGEEIFVRLSAFDDDKRIDKTKKRLRPGSFSTTMDDYVNCKKTNDDPIERYALPNNDKIKWAFYIHPKRNEYLQRGIVQPAYGKRGGGKEVYFDKGTTDGTFIKQTPY